MKTRRQTKTTYTLDKLQGFTVTVAGGGGVITKGFTHIRGSMYMQGGMDAIESMLLSLACLEVDISKPDIQEAALTALDALENHM